MCTLDAKVRVRIALLCFALPFGCGSGAGCGSPQRPEQPPEAKPSTKPEVPRTAAHGDETPPEPSAPAATAEDLERALAYDPADPLANLEAADALDRHARGEVSKAAPEANACAVIDPGRRVWPAAGPPAITAVGRGFVVSGYAVRDGREQLFAVHVPERGLPQPIGAFAIEPPYPRARTAAPGLAARDESDIALAYSDGAGKLLLRRLRVGGGGGGAKLEIASGIDTRFEPAVSHSPERTLVAWTVGSTPMRAQLAVISAQGAVVSRHDLTPQSMGASAPAFVSGANPPVLVAVDARDGFSPILRIDIGEGGLPQPATVALPVGMVATPPELSAASSSIGTYVAYAGIGSAATSAVGLVAIAPVAGAPLPIVKGTGYGPLHLSAVAAPRAVLVAADAPAPQTPAEVASADKSAPAEKPARAPREVQVRVVGLQGPGPATVLRGPGSGASHAAIARDDGGTVAVAFSSDSGVYVAKLRCDDGD
jgi:hypothetical protein